MDQELHYDIFISYSRHDKEIVSKIVNFLRNNGYIVWVDTEGINSGEAFSGVITEAIENSDIVLFFSSKASNSSKWTRREIFLSSEEEKIIIPVKLDSTSYNNQIKLLLCDLDYIDLSNPKDREDGKSQILNNVRNYLGERITMNTLESYKVDHNTSSIWKQLIINWTSRSFLINLFLLSYSILLLVGLLMVLKNGIVNTPSIILGGVGVTMLYANKEDGVMWVALSCLLWTLCSAYYMPSNMTRFFQQSSFVVAWLPLIIACLPLCLMFKKNTYGQPWWRKCKKISFVGIIGLLLCGIFWIWIIAFDTYTKLGLSSNLRYFIQSLFS